MCNRAETVSGAVLTGPAGGSNVWRRTFAHGGGNGNRCHGQTPVRLDQGGRGAGRGQLPDGQQGAQRRGRARVGPDRGADPGRGRRTRLPAEHHRPEPGPAGQRHHRPGGQRRDRRGHRPGLGRRRAGRPQARALGAGRPPGHGRRGRGRHRADADRAAGGRHHRRGAGGGGRLRGGRPAAPVRAVGEPAGCARRRRADGGIQSPGYRAAGHRSPARPRAHPDRDGHRVVPAAGHPQQAARI